MFHRCIPLHIGRWHRGAWAYAYAHQRADSSPTTYETRRHEGRGTSGFGIRRPLRYLAYHLDLDDGQLRRVAAAFDRLKTEREQTRVDELRTANELGELVAEHSPGIDDVKAALQPRVSATERQQLAVARAVHDIAQVLDEEQRQQFVALLSSQTIKL